MDNLILNGIQALAETEGVRRRVLKAIVRLEGDSLKVKVITNGVIVSDDTLKLIQDSIADYRAVGKTYKGTGYRKVTNLLIGKGGLSAKIPIVSNTEDGFMVSFEVDC